MCFLFRLLNTNIGTQPRKLSNIIVLRVTGIIMYFIYGINIFGLTCKDMCFKHKY
jgi:hypothetical protein